jgi:integrase
VTFEPKLFRGIRLKKMPIYIVMRETGARRDEILSLQHWQVDRERGVVTFAKRTKNGKSTVAPLTERAIEALDSIPILPGCPYVFYNPKTGTRWFDARKPWVAARNAAKHPWLRVRDLRPAFGIEASEKGVPMHFIQSALGHSSVAVTERYYAKFVPDTAAKALREIVESGRKAVLAQHVAQHGKDEVAA